LSISKATAGKGLYAMIVDVKVSPAQPKTRFATRSVYRRQK
jgi:hypothetical protein